MEKQELSLFPDGVPSGWCCPINRAYVVMKKITGGEFYIKKANSIGFKISDDICDYFMKKKPVLDSDQLDKFYSVILSYGDIDICNNILEKLKQFREESSRSAHASANLSNSDDNIEEEPDMDLSMSKSEESESCFQESLNKLKSTFQREIDELKKIVAENTKEIINIFFRIERLEHEQPMDIIPEQDSDGQASYQQTINSQIAVNIQDDNHLVNENNNSSTANNQNVSEMIKAEKSSSTKNSPEISRSKSKKSFGKKELLNILEVAHVKAQQKWKDNPNELMKLTGTKSEEIKKLLTSKQEDGDKFLNQIAEILYSEDSFLNTNEPEKVILNSEGESKAKKTLNLLNNRTIRENFEKMKEIISSHGGQFFKKKQKKAIVAFEPNHEGTEHSRIKVKSNLDQEIFKQEEQKKVNFKREKLEIATSTTNDNNDQPGVNLDPPMEENIQGTDSDNEISIIEPSKKI